MPLLNNPLADSKFALNALEFVGLVGGAEVISVMDVIPLYRYRRWLGWYNTPGSFDIARHLFGIAESFQKRRYNDTPPIALPGLRSQMGPTFVAAFPETEMREGQLGYLAVERFKEMVKQEKEKRENGKRETEKQETEKQEKVDEETFKPISVTLFDFPMDDRNSFRPPFHLCHTLLIFIPIVTSIAACFLCCSIGDWYMFSVILVGICTTGITSIVVGFAKLNPELNKPDQRAYPGNGVFTCENQAFILRGRQSTVSMITGRRFSLGGSMWLQAAIYVCSGLYLGEGLTQLILIPQGTLFGQIMFIISLFVSWTYSCHLISFKERLQVDLLFSNLRPEVHRFRVRTRTTMGVFVCLLLFRGTPFPSAKDYDRILSAFLPNATPVWRIWREKVISRIEQPGMSLSCLQEDYNLPPRDLTMLRALLAEAEEAFEEFSHIN